MVVGLGSVLAFLAWPAAGVHARLALRNSEHVHVNQAVPVRFDQPVDLSRVDATIDPPTPIVVTKWKNELVIAPAQRWDTARRYTVKLSDVPTAGHNQKLHGWSASFFTQPRVGLAAVAVDGQPTDPSKVVVGLRSKLELTFTLPMKPATVTLLGNGQPIPASSIQWSTDGMTASVTPPGMVPYQQFQITVAPSSESTYGDPLTDASAIAVTPQALLPVNTTSGIDANFKPVSPIEIVVENSGAARPQAGLQQADIVYEYVSEYSISRMTAIYFNKPPGLVGPVRSCRMINPYLAFAFDGYAMCSGASVGTLHHMFGDPLVPGSINDFDQGNHFFRVGFRAAPHNLYTDGDRTVKIRSQWALPPPRYQLDPPHDDVDMGAPADPPGVPLHFVSYTYDAGTRQYLRIDHDAPFIDDGTHEQLHVKNVILLHVPFHDAGWVEDDSGGAHSIWYDMLGSGPAEIYSDGKLVHATWHMGQGGPQPYSQNHDPVYFTDDQGRPIELNSGLTWIHVIGNGQSS